MYVAMWKLLERWHLENSSESTQGDSREWIIEVVLAEFSLLRFSMSWVIMFDVVKVIGYLKVPYNWPIVG